MKESSNLAAGLLLRIIFCSLVVFQLPAAAGAQTSAPGGERRARELWEQAVAAKGGRERLHGVESFLLSYEETTRNFLGVVVHRGPVRKLYALPDRSWVWDDGLPPPFKLSVGTLDLRRDRGCTLYAGAARPACGPATRVASNPGRGISLPQYLYLMETRWVRPVPFGVSAGRVGRRKVDVLHARFGDERIDYHLDRESRLPLRVNVFHGAQERPTLTLDFSEYHSVAGIQMPGRQKKGKLTFQLNPSYDEDIFERPPSIEAGPEAWQRPPKAS